MSAADESELEELEEVLETVEEDDDESEDAVPPTVLLEARHCRAIMKSEAGTRDNKRVCGNESATCRRKGHAEQRLKGLQAKIGVYDTCAHKDGLDGYWLSYQSVAQAQGQSAQTYQEIATLGQSSPSGDSAVSFFDSPTSMSKPKSVSKDDNDLVMMMKAMQEEQANTMRQLLTYQQEQAAIQAKEIAKLQSELASMKVKDEPAVKSTKKQVTLQVPPPTSTYTQSNTMGQVDSDEDDEEEPNEYVHGAGDGKHAWYAVVSGNEVGLFNSWKFTESVVRGYPNAIYCGFKRKAHAIRWWKQERAQLAALDFQKGAAIGPTIQPRTSDSVVTPAPTGILLHDPSAEKNTWDTDSSKGRKIHDVHIDVESEVLSLLCPDGVSVDVQTQLAESALDVISLPGKQGVSVSSNSIDVLAQSVSEALEYTRHQGRQEFWRDTQWQSPTRIGISAIRDRPTLFEKYRTLRSVKEKVMKAMKGKFRAILSKAGWDSTSILSWLNTGFLPRFIARTYDWYLLLVQRAQEIACVQPWSHVERFLSYHKEEFLQIRMISTSRLSMLANNYVYLRDAQEDNFAGVEYHESVITDLMTLVDKIQGDKKPSTKGCNHCGSTKHKGHKKKCPFKDVSSAVAKELVEEATELIEEENQQPVHRKYLQAQQYNLSTFGTITWGLDTGRHSLTRLHHAYRVGPVNHEAWVSTINPPATFPVLDRITSDRLPPVDVILVDHKYRDNYAKISEKVEQLVLKGRPRIVIESYPISVINQLNDFPLDKNTIQNWNKLEYSTSGRYTSAKEHNGQVSQDRMMICHLWRQPVTSIQWAPCSIFSGRSMNNALRYRNVPSSAYCKSVKKDIPLADRDCMPSTPGSLIKTALGIRRCLADEVAIAKGQPASELTWRSSSMPTGFAQAVKDCTAVVLWETALQSLYTDSPTISDHIEVALPDNRISQHSCWSWRPPSHDIRSVWYHSRIQHLVKAISQYPESQGNMYINGLKDLERHYHNYDEHGPQPQHLQLLWWEFPNIHWDEVRQGSPCNFLNEPSSVKEVEQDFDEDQLDTVSQFIDELVNLGTLYKTSIEAIHCIAPLFCVPKPGQPGEWRVIADFKRGGQNSCIGADPCYLQRIEHIVEHLYTGGYTAVVDASKYFYQFKTCPHERKYMGLAHPKTGDIYHYCGLPMGSSNSPAISSRLGYAFIRTVYNSAPHLFQGSWAYNTWENSENHGMLNGHGLVLITKSGLPAVQIYAWIDDFMIHGPDLASTEAALTAFMEVAFNCGLLCHPAKLAKPSQETKYCGLLINTVSTPRLCIPPRKRDRAINMIKYCLTRPSTVSGLVIAVLTGVLESLVAITFANLGRSYLRHLYVLLNIEPAEIFDPYARYYQDVILNTACRQDLNWWLSMLSNNDGTEMFATISPQVTCLFGDGSGSGTGGMFVEKYSTPIAWMGTWDTIQQQQTSNWKELYTVLLSLLQIKQKPPIRRRYQNSTLLYFTDNMVTYYVMYKGRSKDPKLQAVLHQIKQIEVELRIILYAIHIPGKVLIQQGTDGLSRGIWPTPYNSPTDQYKFALTLLQPVKNTQEIIQWLRQRFNIYWMLKQCADISAEDILFQNTIFFPAPEIAQQLLCILLRYWVEKPYHTRFCLVLPRVMQASWSKISKHLVKEDIKLSLIPPKARPDIFTDIILVYALTFSPSLPEFRMDSPPAPLSHRRHRKEAEELRGLGCVKAGLPFTSRLKDGDGLQFPKVFPFDTFICEGCTVRFYLNSELTYHPQHTVLLMLERMRMIDMLSQWTKGTLDTYRGKLKRIRKFEQTYKIILDKADKPQTPPDSVAIPLMWIQEQYSLAPSSSRSEKSTVAYTTLRGIRSAYSANQTWELFFKHPGKAFIDQAHHLLLQNEGGRDTDSAVYQGFTAGMSKRIGEDSRPSCALQHQHVEFIDQELARQISACRTDNHRKQIILAGMANLIAWLGWLRGGELFGLQHQDIKCIKPEDGPKYTLPPNTGAFLLQLAPSTKSSQTKQADVVIAYQTSSGLSLGRWWALYCQLTSPQVLQSSLPLFLDLSSEVWTSSTFRSRYIYPLLNIQRMQGEATLQLYTDQQQLERSFWSMHSYRRGGRTQVSTSSTRVVRKANEMEIYEHGRWRISRSRMNMAAMYLQMTLTDRLAITMLCM